MGSITLWLRYGGAGHENEYIVRRVNEGVGDPIRRIEDSDTCVFDRFKPVLEKLLPEHLVRNRSTRLEILGNRDDGLIESKVKEAYSQMGIKAEVIWDSRSATWKRPQSHQ